MSHNVLPNPLVHLSGVSPAPRRDFFDFQVSVKEKKVTLVKWTITPRQEEGKSRPSQDIDLFEDFPSDIMLRYIPFVFGKDIVQYVKNIIDGHYDWLVRLPDDVLIHLISYVNLEDINSLSQVCKHLRKVCSSNMLWQQLFTIYMPSLMSDDVIQLAEKDSWKTVFFSRIFERKVKAKQHLQSMTPRIESPDVREPEEMKSDEVIVYDLESTAQSSSQEHQPIVIEQTHMERFLDDLQDQPQLLQNGNH